MKTLSVSLFGLVLFICSAQIVCAQAPAAPYETGGATLSPPQLSQLVAPIALYPDPLIAEILPAATFPSEIVVADRYDSQGGDPNQIPDQGWDPSVQALAHYPNVLKWMDDNLAWTTQLGQAFQNQQDDVMNAIQQLRGQAQNLGNLPSTPQENVVDTDGDIEILPTDPDQMYVPSYQPDQIYYTPGVYSSFSYWLPVGGWLGFDWDWHRHRLISWGRDHPRPNDWWHETPGQRHSYIADHPVHAWRGGGGAGLATRGGRDRGYESQQVYRSYAARPEEPARGAPRMITPPMHTITPRVENINPGVSVIHSAPTTFRNVPAFQSPARSGGFFTGGQTGREAVESSARGQASRGEIRSGGGEPAHAAPAPTGGGGHESGGFGGGRAGGGHR